MDSDATRNEQVIEYWLEHFVNDAVGLCSLCGNTGVIDTRKTAKSRSGVKAGRLNYCICPNGQEMRKAGVGFQWR